jgi:hypothetical protein
MESIMKQASFLDTLKTVLWAMIGIRSKAAHDQAKIRPVHVVVLAIVFVIVFVLTLRFIVSLVVS